MIGVGMPAWLKLNQFGRELGHFFETRAYLVGSAAKGKQWRDVDVRVILDDEKFHALFGPGPGGDLNLRWQALCLAFAARGREITGLPVDFQIQTITHANGQYGGEPRHALIFADYIEGPRA